MKKVYIAGKIGDLPKEEYELNFSLGKKEVIEMGFLAVSPCDLPHNHKRNWSSYMKEDINALMDCDSVYVLRNWRTSPGARVEVNLAVELGIDIIFQK